VIEMDTIGIVYPEVDIRKDKNAKISMFLCFMQTRTMAMKATTIEEVRERCADEPAFHVVEISDGMVFNHLVGQTRMDGKEVILTKSFDDNDRIMNVVMVLYSDGSRKVISMQRRLPREYMEQLRFWQEL